MGNQLQFYFNIACLYVSLDDKIKIAQNYVFTETLYQSNLKSSLLINLNKRSKHPCKWNILLEIYFRNITRKETCKTIYVVGIIFFFYGKLSVNCVLQKGLI